MTGASSSFSEQKIALLNTGKFSNLLDVFDSASVEFAENPRFIALGKVLHLQILTD